MCIAILKKAGAVLTREALYNCHLNNKDGCGFAYVNTDIHGVKKLKIKKSMSFNTFYVKYLKAVEENADSHFLIHFRIATHGTVDEYNCHPFQINERQVFIHNGIIPRMLPKDKSDKRSDTRIFKDTILAKLPRYWERNDAILALLEERIGMSKVIMLDVDNNYTFLREDLGHWRDDVWYSNNAYMNRPQVFTYKSSYWTDKQEGYAEKIALRALAYKEEKEERRTAHIFGLAQKKRESVETVECEWCSDYTVKAEAYRINVDGVDVICCKECSAIISRDELFQTYPVSPIL